MIAAQFYKCCTNLYAYLVPPWMLMLFLLFTAVVAISSLQIAMAHAHSNTECVASFSDQVKFLSQFCVNSFRFFLSSHFVFHVLHFSFVHSVFIIWKRYLTSMRVYLLSKLTLQTPHTLLYFNILISVLRFNFSPDFFYRQF